jgi:uncharacterized tellurite resistance protein B-like protein
MLLENLKTLFKTPSDKTFSATLSLELVSAVLLIEVAKSDFDFDDSERKRLMVLLNERFALEGDDLKAVIQQAEQRVESSTSLHEFTREINEQCDPEQKVALLESMWRMAFADGELDKYEEHLIRRVADLLYVPHSRFMTAKHAAR